MKDMVETVADAIYNAEDPQSGDHIATVIHLSEHLDCGGDLPEQLEMVRDICRAAARAAIAALCPPSEYMMQEGLRRLENCSFLDLRLAWGDMIRAALREHDDKLPTADDVRGLLA